MNACNVFFSLILPCYLNALPDEFGAQECTDTFNSTVPSNKAYNKNYKCLQGKKENKDFE